MVVTALPGASASDVEKLVTEPLEDAIRKVADIKFSSSTSRENVSFILVRFDEIGAADSTSGSATCAGRSSLPPPRCCRVT